MKKSLFISVFFFFCFLSIEPFLPPLFSDSAVSSEQEKINKAKALFNEMIALEETYDPKVADLYDEKADLLRAVAQFVVVRKS